MIVRSSARLIPAILLLSVLAITGCGAPPPIPDDNLYDLGRGAQLNRLEQPLFDGQMVVQAPRALGARGERGMLHAVDSGDAALQQYHYHQWIDTPPVLLQRRMIVDLRDANIASLVSDRAAERLPILRVSGHLDRFDRVGVGGGWQAVVHWEIRVDQGEGRGVPLLLKHYRRAVDSQGKNMVTTAAAFSQAVDEIMAEFMTDLEAALE